MTTGSSVASLNVGDIAVLLTSLDYSVERIRQYQHDNYEMKQASLQPLLDAQTKLRQIRDEFKTE